MSSLFGGMAGSAKYLASVTHIEHDHNLLAIIDQIHDPVMTLPWSIFLLSQEPPHPMRKPFRCEIPSTFLQLEQK